MVRREASEEECRCTRCTMTTRPICKEEDAQFGPKTFDGEEVTSPPPLGLGGGLGGTPRRGNLAFGPPHVLVASCCRFAACLGRGNELSFAWMARRSKDRSKDRQIEVVLTDIVLSSGPYSNTLPCALPLDE